MRRDLAQARAHVEVQRKANAAVPEENGPWTLHVICSRIPKKKFGSVWNRLLVGDGGRDGKQYMYSLPESGNCSDVVFHSLSSRERCMNLGLSPFILEEVVPSVAFRNWRGTRPASNPYSAIIVKGEFGNIALLQVSRDFPFRSLP